MIFNELAQWAVIGFVAVLCLGLSRQLGVFITRRQEELAEAGPPIGRLLPEYLVPQEAAGEIRRLLAERGTTRAVLAVIDEGCSACNALIGQLEHEPLDVARPLIAIVRKSGVDFQERVRAVADLVLNDPDGGSTDEAKIFATPFVMILDVDLKLARKHLTGDLIMAVESWDRASKGAAHDDAESTEEVLVHA